MHYEPESRLNVKQGAKVRGVSESKMNKDRCLGGGPPYELDGRRIKYRYGTLIEWMTARTRTSTSDTGEPP